MSRSLGGRSLTTRSPIEISPAVISSRPATIRSVVVLPHPDGPTNTMNSLSRMVRFTSLTACTSSYFLFRSFRTTCAMGDLALRRWWWRNAAGGRRPVLPRAGAILAQPSARVTLVPRLPLDGSRQAAHVVLHEERVDEGDRDGAQESPRHQLPPEIDVAADQLRDDAD